MGGRGSKSGIATSRKGKTESVKSRGGFQITLDDGSVSTFFSYRGKVYNITDLSKSPEKLDTDKTATQLVQGMLNRGIDVKILSPQEIKQRENEYNNRPYKDADYSLGTGLPFDNIEYRRIARRQKINDRTARKHRKQTI